MSTVTIEVDLPEDWAHFGLPPALDARLTGRRKAAYWKTVFGDFVAPTRSKSRVGLAARDGEREFFEDEMNGLPVHGWFLAGWLFGGSQGDGAFL